MAEFSRWPPDPFKCGVYGHDNIRFLAASTLLLHDVEKCFPMLVLKYHEQAFCDIEFSQFEIFHFENMGINDLIAQNTRQNKHSYHFRFKGREGASHNIISCVDRNRNCSKSVV